MEVHEKFKSGNVTLVAGVLLLIVTEGYSDELDLVTHRQKHVDPSGTRERREGEKEGRERERERERVNGTHVCFIRCPLTSSVTLVPPPSDVSGITFPAMV